MEELVLRLQSLDPLAVYAAVFGIALIENIFPPSPSDVLVVFAGSLAGVGDVALVPVILCATAGSTVGFVAMYKIGQWFGERILERGKIRFIPVEGVRKVEGWFGRYGYWLIAANRFMSGTRAVISFFAGMSELHLAKTTALSFVSALAWNTILVIAGFTLGKNWSRIGFYLSTYSYIVTAIIVILVLLFLARYLYRRNGGKEKA